MLQRCVRLAGVDIVENGMTMRERPAFGVLAGQADRYPLDDQRRERERLRLPPVDASSLDRLATTLELRAELGMCRESIGNA
jgi:hypothetical protein